MGSIERRLEALEIRVAPEPPDRSKVRARMSAYLDEIAAARREGREPHEAAAAIMEAFERRRSRES